MAEPAGATGPFPRLGRGFTRNIDVTCSVRLVKVPGPVRFETGGGLGVVGTSVVWTGGLARPENTHLLRTYGPRTEREIATIKATPERTERPPPTPK